MESNETALCFGPEDTLIGVLTPAAHGARSGVGCLLLNVGVNPRVGPRRINVKAARELAAAGIPCLRFDLSGVGDSRASGGQADFRQQALVDLRAALDELQRATGLDRFIVFGICSGGANGMALALADPRVVGLVMFDGYIFLTKAVRLERKLRRWAAFPFNPALRRGFHAWNDWMQWARAPLDASARRKALGRLLGHAAPQTTEETGLFDADGPEYDAPDFERDMGKLVERGVDVYLMYSATLHSVEHDRDLLSGLRGAPFLQKVRYKFWPDIDHTFTTLAAQRKLLDTVRAWAVELAARQRGGATAERGAPAPDPHTATAAGQGPANGPLDKRLTA